MAMILGVMAIGFCQALTTNIIDVAALGKLGTGTTNGWEVVGVDSYSDKPGVRLNAGNEYVISETFAKPIRKLLIKVKSSSQEDRKLAFCPWDGKQFNREQAAVCAYSPNKDTYVDQELTFEGDYHCFQITFDLLEGGGNTGWGFYYLAVVTADLPVLAPPEEIVVTTNMYNEIRLKFENNEVAVGNRVYVYQTIDYPEVREENTGASYGFDDIAQGGGNPQSVTDKIRANYYGIFEGQNLYSYPNSQGILQGGSGDKRGVLKYCGLPDYTGRWLELVIAKHPSDYTAKRNTIALQSIRDGVTNMVENLVVTADLTPYRVSLDQVAGGSELMLNGDSTIKSGYRFLLDRFTILDRYEAAYAETNSVTRFDWSAESPRLGRLKGLPCGKTYLATVTSTDSNETESVRSEWIEFVTPEKGAELNLRLR